MLVFTGALICAGLVLTFVNEPFWPVHEAAFPWMVERTVDSTWGGTSENVVYATGPIIKYTYRLKPTLDAPHAGVAIAFNDSAGHPAFVNLARFDQVGFIAACEPTNILSISVETYDEAVSAIGESLSNRKAIKHFDCDKTPQKVLIDLNNMHVPLWWLEHYGLSYTDDGYDLSKTFSLIFSNSLQSPIDTPSMVAISELTLYQRRWGFLIGSGIVVALMWAGFFWHLKSLLYRRTAGPLLIDSIKKEEPATPHAPHIPERSLLTVKSLREKETETLMALLESQFADTDMTLPLAASKLGINRNKINAILKKETGMTFSVYLNKLRLEEACGLLKENQDASVASIADKVGYRNVASFNRSFKNLYGCTPNEFRLAASGGEP